VTASEANPVLAPTPQWEGKRSWKVEISPEVDGLPPGILRGATRACLDELKIAVPNGVAAVPLELKLTLKDGRIQQVAKTGGDPNGILPATFIPCLERSFAKVKSARAPNTIALSVSLSPAE
jgi:hypothetical protein